MEASAASPKNVVPTELEAGLAPEAVWTMLRREKSTCPDRIRTPDRPIRSVVTIERQPYRLNVIYYKSRKWKLGKPSFTQVRAQRIQCAYASVTFCTLNHFLYAEPVFVRGTTFYTRNHFLYAEPLFVRWTTFLTHKINLLKPSGFFTYHQV